VFLYLKGGIIIELEELEIIVTAKIEEAVREVMKLAPQIKQTMKQVQESFSKVDMKEFNKKVQQSMENLKRILKDVLCVGILLIKMCVLFVIVMQEINLLYVL